MDESNTRSQHENTRRQAGSEIDTLAWVDDCDRDALVP